MTAITLPHLFSDHMVLQQNQPLPIWGTAQPNEEILVRFESSEARTKANEQGYWKASLPPLPGGLIGRLTVTGEISSPVTFSNVAIGEVWICSGQSNMEWPLFNASEGTREKAAADHPEIRLLRVPILASDKPVGDTQESWQICSPNSAANFSAVGYFFGRKLQTEIQVPVGLIQSAVGGTPVEAWTPVSALAENPLFGPLLQAREENLKMTGEEIRRLAAEIESEWKRKVAKLFESPTSPAPGWFDPANALDGWTAVQVPGAVDTQLGLDTEGSFWARKTFDLTAEDASGPALLSLGPVDDFDFTWVNGHLVGGMGLESPQAWCTNREYPVVNGILHPGTNVIVVRIIDHFMEAGFNGRAGQIFLAAASGRRVSLAGTWQARLEIDIGSKPPLPNNDWNSLAGTLYDGMIAPLVPFAMRGVIWYQGESNVGRAAQYCQLFPAMIEAWRSAWSRDFAFHFVQLANFKNPCPTPGESSWAELREAQAAALTLPGTGMAVAIDLGEAYDVHPRNKKDVGERLAALALEQDYGKPKSGKAPTFRAMRMENAEILLEFSGALSSRPLPATYDLHTETGESEPLVRRSCGEVEGFAICGSDRIWKWAEAMIEGRFVRVWSKDVPEPVAVRYAWADNPFCNLRGENGMPVAPFRFGETECLTTQPALANQ